MKYRILSWQTLSSFYSSTAWSVHTLFHLFSLSLVRLGLFMVALGTAAYLDGSHHIDLSHALSINPLLEMSLGVFLDMGGAALLAIGLTQPKHQRFLA
ncbi:hypothetical protein [Aliagarivorans marinus]|uniref:hypothetical protein n=1 Tax=Aliagarivorans marinus TaxID=561965 RepID=UPI0003F613F0|nr:hypothetical protein [Aliagarivorans marinus]